jgi:CSLREA domain-containing protein
LKTRTLRFLLLIILIFSWFLPTRPTLAAGNIIVNSLADTVAVNDLCTLREAIQNANEDSATNADCAAGNGADTITFSLSGTITVNSLLLMPLNTPMLTIDGSGQTVTIDGNNSVRIGGIDTLNSLTLNHLTITNGRTNAGGGGIFNYGTLIVTNCTFSGNNAIGSGSVGGIGGGIYNTGTLTVSNSIFSGNNSTNGDGGGGGIYNNSGTAIISNSTFSANTVTNGNGGAIFDNFGTLTISNSTFSNNSNTNNKGGGGAIYNWNGLLTITNSTFSGNSANGGGAVAGAGGALFSYSSSALTTIRNTTFSGNSADFWGGGIVTSGGTINLRNTILANNSPGNCGGSITNSGNNIDSGAACTWGSASGSLSNTDPLLGPLADNGGSTLTFALLAGSPAIDAGDDVTCNAAPVNGLDQRGISRLQGYHCDIGSYEMIAPPGYHLFLPLILRQ